MKQVKIEEPYTVIIEGINPQDITCTPDVVRLWKKADLKFRELYWIKPYTFEGVGNKYSVSIAFAHAGHYTVTFRYKHDYRINLVIQVEVRARNGRDGRDAKEYISEEHKEFSKVLVDMSKANAFTKMPKKLKEQKITSINMRDDVSRQLSLLGIWEATEPPNVRQNNDYWWKGLHGKLNENILELRTENQGIFVNFVPKWKNKAINFAARLGMNIEGPFKEVVRGDCISWIPQGRTLLIRLPGNEEVETFTDFKKEYLPSLDRFIRANNIRIIGV